MIRFNWRITDDLASLTLSDFSSEHGMIYGYCELQINTHQVGFFPDISFAARFAGDEPLDYWFKHFESIIHLENGESHIMQLLSENLLSLSFVKLGDNLDVRCKHTENGELWTEVVPLADFTAEICFEYEQYLDYIKKANRDIWMAVTKARMDKGVS